ncbi:MAG: hypothetical protein ABI621_13010 [Chloroflexota bacterium]
MLQKFHAEITKKALGEHFSAAALDRIIAANVYQDRLAGQIGHDEFHVDNNAFEKSYAYIQEQRAIVISSIQLDDTSSAWAAFGRLAHTAQDFYAHSNYIDLWLSRHVNGSYPTPPEIDPVDPDLIDTPALRSGKIYLLLEAFSFVKILKPLVMPFLPRDSHAWMNLDSPEQGPNFTFAFHAAVNRTKIEFEKTTVELSQDLLDVFADK